MFKVHSSNIQSGSKSKSDRSSIDQGASIDIDAFVRRQNRVNRNPNRTVERLHSELEQRLNVIMYGELVDRLDLIRLEPTSVLAIGLPVGDYSHSLSARYPAASITAGTIAEPPQRSVWQRWRDRRTQVRRLDPLHLDVADRSIDVMCVAWIGAWYPLAPALLECRRVLKPGGLLMMSLPGTDTLAELKNSAPQLVHPFPDVQDVGAALTGAGFVDSVVDIDRFDFAVDAAAVLRWLSRNGWSNSRLDRSRSLHGRSHWQSLCADLNTQLELRRTAGFTVEAVYGHAFAPPDSGPGTRRVAFDTQLHCEG